MILDLGSLTRRGLMVDVGGVGDKALKEQRVQDQTRGRTRQTTDLFAMEW